MMKKFIVLKTYIKKRDMAIAVDDISNIEQDEDSDGKVYTKVNCNNGVWVKVTESVSEVVKKIHSFSEMEDKE